MCAKFYFIFSNYYSSYKEHSDAATDEDDVIESTNAVVSDIPDDAEVIEKVLTHRLGRPGGMKR